MSFLGGVERGLAKGVQYIVDVARLSEWSLTHNQMDVLKDCLAVGTAFVAEMADEAGTVTTHAMELAVSAALGIGHDPNAGSRHLAQAVIAKGKSLGWK